MQLLEPKNIDHWRQCLPQGSEITLKNEVDRFGFSAVLNYWLKGVFQPKRAYCNWIHGWKWYPAIDVRMLGLTSAQMKSKAARKKPIVVQYDHQLELLKQNGFENVSKGPLSYAYLFDEDVAALAESYRVDFGRPELDKIIYLPKSQETMATRSAFTDCLEWANDNEKIKAQGVLCVFSGDLVKDSVRAQLKNQSLPIVLGAVPNDKFALIRQRNMLKQFNECCTNSIGTHIPIAAAEGLTITVLTEIFDERSASYFMRDKIKQRDIGMNDQYFQYLGYVHSAQYFKKHYPHLLASSKHNRTVQAWGRKQLADSIICKQDLVSILGWSLPSFINAAANTVRFKLENEVLIS